MYDAIQKKTVLVISLIPYRPWVLEVKLNRWKRNQVNRAIQTSKMLQPFQADQADRTIL